MRATRILLGNLGSGSSETRVGTVAPNTSRLPWKTLSLWPCRDIDRVERVQ
jgi:hypothetical protein